MLPHQEQGKTTKQCIQLIIIFSKYNNTVVLIQTHKYAARLHDNVSSNRREQV